MCHMTSGICQCAQRTCSLCMYNMLHEHDACKIHTHMSSFVRDMFQDAKAKLYKTELAIFKLYGHVWTTWFSGFCHWNSLPSWTELQQELSNRLILCWGRHVLESNISGIFFLRAYIREKSHLKRVAVLSVLVGGFQFDKVVCTWSLSSFFNTLYERYHET